MGEQQYGWDEYDTNPGAMIRIVEGLKLSGDALTPDVEAFLDTIDRIAPRKATLVIEDTPPGFPPEEVRRAWVGIALPIRILTHESDEVIVNAREAIEMLRGPQPEAFEWWRNYYDSKLDGIKDKITDYGQETGICFANMSFLTFDPTCGMVIP